MIRTRVWTEPDAFERLKGPWQDLVRNSECTPFQTWEWNATWHRHLGAHKRPCIVSVYEGDELLALLPLVRHRAPWPCYRLAATGPSDVLGPIFRTDALPSAGEALNTWLAEQRGLVDLHQIRSDSAWGQG